MRTRREPPPFRRVRVSHTERLTPRMARVTFEGDLAGLVVDEPAASVRLLLPSPGADELVIPTWNGNEFLLPDDSRPALRTFTPRRVNPDPSGPTLDIDVVLHGHGVASTWAETAQPGAEAAVSGPGRGYTVDRSAPAFLLAGDETAIPAITQLLEALPPETPREVFIEIADPAARQPLPGDPTWLDPGTLADAIKTADIADGTRIWAAGEAAVMQRIRRHLFDERGIPRDHTEIRGYWKVERRQHGERQVPL
jgi:NADPH-dependent ferric siderophore reductase